MYGEGFITENPAYVLVQPSHGRGYELFDLMRYLREETSQRVYSPFEDFNFRFHPGHKLMIRLSFIHKKEIGEDGNLETSFKSYDETMMRINFLAHLCEQYDPSRRYGPKPLVDAKRHPDNLEFLGQFAPQPMRFPVVR